ncbi:acetyl-CoA synthetase-like protein [Sanghuangporus baumii]|uniref:Acetyl-CoA synthetase-like protein n=1 Tax=Sanghuangporus baumii TaxID=108892 RepID=A0A9Q5HQN5_SANBA|nr:acetyl-CoA synthetase-like protein [Sanghuangporus baumii]
MFSSPKYTPLEKPWPENIDVSKQGIEVPGTRRPGQTGAWGLSTVADQPHVRVLPDIFELGLKLSTNERYLGHRPIVSKNPLKFADHYVWETYNQVDQRRRNVGSALHRYFTDGVLGGGEMPTVGIWSQNRPEWQIIDLALHAYAKVGVSLYDTLGKDSVEYIINHAHLTVIFATVQHIPNLLALKSRVPMLRMVVSIDDLSEETKQVLTSWGALQDIQVKELRDLEEYGKANRIEPLPATPEQIATLCYTSRANVLNVTALGGATGFYTGDPLRLLEDMSILKPNFFPSVPRVLNRIYQIAMQAAELPGLKGFLFRSAVEAKLKKLRETGDNTHVFWDRLVFRKIQAVLGGNIKLLISGSAPISIDVMDFLRIAFACEVVEGYGMTENCAVITRTWPGDPSCSGTVGAPQPCTEIKLVDVTAMGYTSEDKPSPRGEICVRGGQCFKGYYKDEKNTRETLDDEGWVHTGDIGEIDSFGRLRIIDRLKNIMKLSQGEYVALERIENAYDLSPLIAQIYVHGDSLRDHLVGIVVPDPIQLAPLVSKLYGKPIAPEDSTILADAIRDTRVVQAILDEMNEEAKNAGLKGFETVKKIHVTLEPFTVDNNMLTPTFKLRRRDVVAKYKDVLEQLYSEPDLAPIADLKQEISKL